MRINFQFSTVIFFLILITACSSNRQFYSNNRNENLDIITDHNKKQSVISHSILYEKIIKDFESNKLTEVQANEAFLLAKTFEIDNKLIEAEKLLEICYKFSPNVPVSLNLIQLKIMLKKRYEAKIVAQHANILFPNNSSIILELIQVYVEEGNLKKASSLLQTAYKKFPDNEPIALLYAYYNQKKRKKILENFTLRNPHSAHALLQLSLIFLNEKNYEKSIFYAKKSYFFDPYNIDTIINIARIEEEQKNYPNAEKFYKAAFEKDMTNNAYAQNYINILLFQNKKQEALSVLLKLEASSDIHAPFPPEFSYIIARMMIINQDYEGARKRLDNLLNGNLAKNIDINEIKFHIAYVYENLHNFSKSIDYLNQIDESSKFFVQAQREKIIVYINNKQIELAKKLFYDYKVRDNSYVEDILFQASTLLFFEKNDEAIKILNQAINLKSNEKVLYLKRIEAYLFASKDMSFIIDKAKYITQRWPSYPEGLNMLGYILTIYSNDLNVAEKFIKKSLNLDPKNAYYLDSLAYVNLKKNNLKFAQENFIEALKYEPNEPIILLHYAENLKLMNNDQEAAKILEKARKIITNMLIYSLGNDIELKSAAKSFGVNFK